MGKAAYIGVDGVARRIKKMALGVDQLARRIKRAYIGVGDVARPCWSDAPEYLYFGTLTELPVIMRRGGGASAGSSAIFAGGNTYMSTTAHNKAQAYTSDLVSVTITGLGSSRYQIASATFNNSAWFAGGLTTSSYSTGAGDKYTADFVRTSKGISEQYTSLAAASDVRLNFGTGGYSRSTGDGGQESGSTYYITSYDVNEVSTSIDTQTNYSFRNTMSACGGIDRVIIYTGSGSNGSSIMDENKVISFLNGVSHGHSDAMVARVKNHLIFSGGYLDQNKVSACTKYGVFTVLSPLCYGRSRSKAAGLSHMGNALFIGTGVGSDLYDENLVHQVVPPVPVLQDYPLGVAAGKYVIVGGGYPSKTIDAYMLK